MQPLISDYLERINTRYQTGISREHAYRGDLQYLLEHLLTDVLVTNEPARIDCGSPDYILTKNDIPVGFIEAKDIGKPLDSKEYKEYSLESESMLMHRCCSWLVSHSQKR